ncbi:NUDIX domain protein, partial [Vibrio parahaemolyticus AQ3810]
FLFRQRGVVL